MRRGGRFRNTKSLTDKDRTSGARIFYCGCRSAGCSLQACGYRTLATFLLRSFSSAATSVGSIHRSCRRARPGPYACARQCPRRQCMRGETPEPAPEPFPQIWYRLPMMFGVQNSAPLSVLFFPARSPASTNCGRSSMTRRIPNTRVSIAGTNGRSLVPSGSPGCWVSVVNSARSNKFSTGSLSLVRSN